MTTNTTPATALAPGFRFHPTDEELVRYYLTRKVRGKHFRIDAIAEVDIYKSEPWDLPGQSRLASRDKEWYFFGSPDKKYGNGSRMNRATGKGYWKATGNDREVRHDMRTIGMKKTLVFHRGRAPGGKRTDWVMHEYRLVDEELGKAGVVQDGFVLCKVFQKSGIGPQNGKHYAPFVEEEWDDDSAVMVPGTEVTDDAVDGDDANIEGNGLEQDTRSEKAPLHQNEDFRDPQTLYQNEDLRDPQNVSFVCKSERVDDCPLPSIDDPEPLHRKKRSRDIDLNPSYSNASGDPPRTTQDPCSSARTPTAPGTTALFGFPLVEAVEPRESPPVPPPRRFDIATFDLSVHPSYLELIDKLQKEIHNISIERETLKIEVMSAQAMINILQSRLEFIGKENEDLKRIPRDV